MRMDRVGPKRRGKSLFIILGLCLIVFIVAISLFIASFNKLMSTHDQNLSDEICTIMTEKMNIAIDSMNTTTQGVATVLSIQDYRNAEEAYNSLNIDSIEKDQFLSIGIIDADKNIYATDAEKREFDKWNLMATAELAAPVSMSVPYRSMLCGQPVVTMFSKFTYGNNEKGWVFITHRFRDLEEIAYTDSMDKDIDVELLNSQSLNSIICVSSDENAVGRWNNAYLVNESLDDPAGKQFNKWLESIKNGESNNSISYYYNGVHYTQSSTKIATMPGWYLIVRIPSSKLSDAMGHFRNYVLNFVIILLIIVIILVISMYQLNRRENQLLEEISEHDTLTGLFNRRAFQLFAKDRITKGRNTALVFIDVDHFKIVNDTLGHDAGDDLLIKFTDILNDCLGNDSVIFRFGGDEFIALIDMESEEVVNTKMLKALKEVHGIKLNSTVEFDEEMSFSAGIARFPLDAENLEELIKCADEALYQIKENGRDGFCWYKNIQNK